MPAKKLRTPAASMPPDASHRREKGLGFLTTNGALYIGPTLNSTLHISHAYNVYIALRGEVSLQLYDGSYSSPLGSVLVAPDYPHRVVDSGAVIAVYYLIPETVEGRLISRFNGRRDLSALPSEVAADLARRLMSFFRNGCSPAEAAETSRRLYASLAPAQGGGDAFDRRIRFVIEYLEDTLEERRVTTSELASSVSLSASRVEHLFKEQVGIPINQYLLWRRLHRALSMFPAGKTLTEVAHEAGFADSAHLSRTFRRMLGIPPSTIVRNIALFQADEAASVLTSDD